MGADGVPVSQTQREEELERIQQAISRKLRNLPPGVTQVLVKRTSSGEFIASAMY